ncbi:hypothetical protein [Okeania sp. KiyG1]|nr:hypothetical protein [Okeania sp. KiyG1]GGA17749.1 hypothetical protein CYANOKiyG1_32070 [Okeania sp. KiyG1]GGA17757.1 hypothetical protein CYANOKiyG1_32080 [Okeania sp. KiyG1]GGA17765.1 hypothetical protein CYANOKiyG1_32090 [Okeania sp. KiyG1]GGA17772.1 hypothetical protein CYANOKiyG1_32100 [Okeania sp. KiyG1]
MCKLKPEQQDEENLTEVLLKHLSIEEKMIDELITALSKEIEMPFQLSVISYQLSVSPFECYLYNVQVKTRTTG